MAQLACRVTTCVDPPLVSQCRRHLLNSDTSFESLAGVCFRSQTVFRPFHRGALCAQTLSSSPSWKAYQPINRQGSTPGGSDALYGREINLTATSLGSTRAVPPLGAPMGPIGSAGATRGLKIPSLPSLPSTPNPVKAAQNRLAEFRTAQQEMLKGPLATYNQLKATVNTVVDSPRRVKEKVLEYQRQAIAFRDNFMLHVEERYQMHRLPILVGGATLGTLALWRGIVGASSMFIEVTDPYSELSCLVLAAAVAGAGTVAARRTYTIDPEGVMSLALASMKKHPGVVEVLGTPLVATSPPCASIVTGGALQLRVKQLVRFESQRLHMLFPVKGSAMQGLVAVEARKRKGKLMLKSVTMDPSTVPDGSQRIIIQGCQSEGTESEVMAALRSSMLRSLDAKPAYDAEDDSEDALEKEANTPKPLSQGGGMYPWERVYERGIQLAQNAKKLISGEK